jgi:phosphate transport system ATP-binding protein
LLATSMSAKPFNLEKLASARVARFGASEEPIGEMPWPQFTVSDLNFYYGKFQALYDINLIVPTKKITALIGPSGCGKSTFLRTLNRMCDVVPHTHVKGKIQIGETDLFTLPPTHLRRRVGMVFQKPSPFPKSIFENVAYGLRVDGGIGRKELKERVEKSLEKAALWNEVKDRLHQSALALSGGQQQRLCIARALAVDPEVLLLDEPCSALDPISTAQIEDLLFELKDQCTVVIVTHNMLQAARIANYVGFFLSGKLIEFDRAKTMYQNPSRHETEDYITGRYG